MKFIILLSLVLTCNSSFADCIYQARPTSIQLNQKTDFLGRSEIYIYIDYGDISSILGFLYDNGRLFNARFDRAELGNELDLVNEGDFPLYNSHNEGWIRIGKTNNQTHFTLSVIDDDTYFLFTIFEKDTRDAKSFYYDAYGTSMQTYENDQVKVTLEIQRLCSLN